MGLFAYGLRLVFRFVVYVGFVFVIFAGGGVYDVIVMLLVWLVSCLLLLLF